MPLLKKENKDQTLILTLSDQDTQNAFSPAMAEELWQALNSQAFSALVLFHDGPFFCSGGNLKFYSQLSSRDEGLKANQRIAEILTFLDQLPVPKSCFINGPCLGGGVELLSCFDWVVASPQALFGLWQRRVGLSYGWGAETRLKEKVAEKPLRNWLLSAKTLSSYEALDLGVVDELSLAVQGRQTCLEWTGRCLSLGPESLACILQDRKNSSKAFSQLWLGEKHMKVLKKFDD